MPRDDDAHPGDATLPDHLRPDVDPVADPEAVVRAPNCRITVLTRRLLRVEYDPEEAFEDRASQLVWDRNHPVPAFEVARDEGTLVVDTGPLRLTYDHGAGEGLSPETLAVELDDGTRWRYGDDPTGNLGGALRTLDGVDGAAPVEPGLLSRDGIAVVEDTDRLVFDDGWVAPRDAATGYEDLYVFGYGTDYSACLDAFTDVAGDAPLLPRWALGNWWSRYWEYTQAELREVVEGFRDRDLPLSVCVVDMDWHVVENPHHDGWTGWTWNDAYFPDPEGFTDWLHEQGLRTTLNLHPAEGVHPHETQYEAVAESMGLDPADEAPVPFDAADPRFLRSYFEQLIHPLERQGVDFWWIDWQQWTESPEMDGLDPLWALNHCHSLDRTRDGRRPFILSRWGGLGGHRYPVGFSGDAAISWDSLRFQPYLTATSGNVAFGWWSHDIGGHWGGTGDPAAFGELYARWAQFGALSPINRIHTTKTPSVDKRPWRFGGEVREALGDALRLRHRLVPYLYAMAWRDHADSDPLVRPMYYHHPEADSAYAAVHQYYLGSELLAAPHLRERDETTHLSRRSVWLPEGEWFDFATGERYGGGAWHARYGDLSDLPVYAKAGAIVPMTPAAQWGAVDNPETLRVVAFPGADNEFTLYEDDGTSLAHREGAFATTTLTQRFDEDELTVEVGAVAGDRTLLPETREYDLRLRGVHDPDRVTVTVGGEERTPSTAYDAHDATLAVAVGGVSTAEAVTVTVETDAASLVDRRDRLDRHLDELLWHFEMPVRATDGLREAEWTTERLDWVGEHLAAMTPAQRRALLETLTGAGMDRLDHAGDDRVVVWNPDAREDVRFRYTAWTPTSLLDGDGDVDHGPVPAFELIDVESPDDATVALRYGDLATVEEDAGG